MGLMIDVVFCASGIDDVSCARSVAALTANAILGEKGRRVFVLRASDRRLHPLVWHSRQLA